MKDQDLALIVSELLQQVDKHTAALGEIRSQFALIKTSIEKVDTQLYRLEEISVTQSSIIRILAERLATIDEVNQRLDKLEAVVFNKGFVE